jgi:DNA invertase Pin-like site-specific DNA recombinase
MNTTEKIRPTHLRRKAYLYIRQSSLYQTEHNRESTQRQYDFQRRALSLGWRADQIEIIDDDLGQSGAQITDRPGFQRLTADVGLGNVGIVLSLEVSRLARNSSDWHHLLEICALTETLILDEDGLYDPNHFNDRLVLGLRGTMSEAELHFLRMRLEGGKLNKARRGELKLGLPAGSVYDVEDRVVLDPDRQVQQAIRLVFHTFRKAKSAWRTVRDLCGANVRLPVRSCWRPVPGRLTWEDPTLTRVLRIVKNPTYAGVYFYGRTRQRKGVQSRTLPMEPWKVFIPNAHAQYISWEEFEENQTTLLHNSLHVRKNGQSLPAREGPALLQGLVVCGRCGHKMTIRYHIYGDLLAPDYVCQHTCTEKGGRLCQRIPGRAIDRAVGELVARAVTPHSIEVALEVFEELRQRHEEVESLHRSQIERAKHEANLAERQFLLADPENRLVTDALEARWNEKLRALVAAEQAYTEWKTKRITPVDPQVREQIRQLAEDFPRVWNHPNTVPRERKRMLRLLVEDVTLTRDQDICVQIRWKGGATETLRLPIPLNAIEARRMPRELLERMAALARNHTDDEIADILNREGRKTGTGLPFTGDRVNQIRSHKRIDSYESHLRRAGMVS